MKHLVPVKRGPEILDGAPRVEFEKPDEVFNLKPDPVVFQHAVVASSLLPVTLTICDLVFERIGNDVLSKGDAAADGGTRILTRRGGISGYGIVFPRVEETLPFDTTSAPEQQCRQR